MERSTNLGTFCILTFKHYIISFIFPCNNACCSFLIGNWSLYWGQTHLARKGRVLFWTKGKNKSELLNGELCSLLSFQWVTLTGAVLLILCRYKCADHSNLAVTHCNSWLTLLFKTLFFHKLIYWLNTVTLHYRQFDSLFLTLTRLLCIRKTSILSRIHTARLLWPAIRYPNPITQLLHWYLHKSWSATSLK